MSAAHKAEFDPREANPPSNWPRTERPLTIALIGWARLSYQGAQGSGYNLSASELAAGLAMSGHRVLYLAAGRKYNLLPWAYISATERWRGVSCFDLVNSPNLSPAAYNFANMDRETRSPRSCGLLTRWLKSKNVDVVHVHSLEGLSLDVLPSLRRAKIPVVVTPHNYWYACPQVDLMYQERHLCMDYEGGARCTSCMRRRTPILHRWKRRLGQSLESVVGQEATGAGRLLARAIQRRVTRAKPVDVIPNPRIPDPDLALGINSAIAPDGERRIEANAADDAASIRKPVSKSPSDANEKFLRSAVHLKVVGPYGSRRTDGIEALGAASAVIPPSDFVRHTYVRLGLDESRTRTVRLGQPHFDQLHRRARRSPFYDLRPWTPDAPRPLRLAFLGAMRPSKGIDVLADAIVALPDHVRRRCQFHIRAQGFDWPIRKRLAGFPEVAFAGAYDLLQLMGEAGEYDVGVLPHVWFENSPLVLLEHLHAGKFVISSRLGGVVEWVDPPRNGMFFAGGDAHELASCIERLVNGGVAIPSPREVHDATPLLRGYPDHVREVQLVYEEVLSGRSVAQTGGNAVTASSRSLPGHASSPLAGRPR